MLSRLKLKKTLKIKKLPNMFIFADKTNNSYVMPAKHYEKLLKNSITRTYRKAPPKIASSINVESKDVAKNLKSADETEQFSKVEAVITMKDQKKSFVNNPTCRLIDPSKSELGRKTKFF